MKNKNFKSNNSVDKRDILIEQCLIDAYCERTGENPDLIEEGWWDNIKAGAAGMMGGLKQGAKNLGNKASNAAKMTGNWFGRKKDQISNVTKNLGALANNQEISAKDPRSITQGISDPAKRIPAAFAKNFGKVQSYAKSLSETFGAFASALEAAGMMNDNVKQLVDGVGEYLGQIVSNKMETAYKLFSGGGQQQAQPQQGIDNAENIDQGDQQAELGSPYEDTPENEEQLNASYNPHINSRGQRLMLESFRRKY